MSQQELYEVVSRWYVTGLLSEVDKDRLRAKYLEDLGNPKTCTKCPDFWNDVQIHFRIQLKQNGFQAMKSTRKYIVNPEHGFIQLFNQSKLIVNEGENSENVEVLTDKKAEALKKINPELFEQNIIIENPDYAPGKTAAAGTAKSGPKAEGVAKTEKESEDTETEEETEPAE